MQVYNNAHTLNVHIRNAHIRNVRIRNVRIRNVRIRNVRILNVHTRNVPIRPERNEFLYGFAGHLETRWRSSCCGYRPADSYLSCRNFYIDVE